MLECGQDFRLRLDAHKMKTETAQRQSSRRLDHFRNLPVKHEGAGAGSRTLNPGFTSLSTASVSESRGGSERLPYSVVMTRKSLSVSWRESGSLSVKVSHKVSKDWNSYAHILRVFGHGIFLGATLFF